VVNRIYYRFFRTDIHMKIHLAPPASRVHLPAGVPFPIGSPTCWNSLVWVWATSKIATPIYESTNLWLVLGTATIHFIDRVSCGSTQSWRSTFRLSVRIDSSTSWPLLSQRKKIINSKIRFRQIYQWHSGN